MMSAVLVSMVEVLIGFHKPLCLYFRSTLLENHIATSQWIHRDVKVVDPLKHLKNDLGKSGTKQDSLMTLHMSNDPFIYLFHIMM